MYITGMYNKVCETLLEITHENLHEQLFPKALYFMLEHYCNKICTTLNKCAMMGKFGLYFYKIFT